LAGEQPVINGDGRQTRDYVFVGDVVRANLAALGLPGFRVYNVGTGIETDVTELFELIRGAVGAGPAATHGPAKAGEQLRSAISSELLEQELGLRIGTPLDRGLETTAAWFREQHRAR
ncbi:MAG TPA: NAD-dependent epimerase/dehydratase family protein, partial [Candidatus Sulfomarinibacteraceae bacterium]|nr:NAD-dependent epimerase/dehydratase family protein [Candidatus Sulfomarinibacteraceae bacterium]